MCETAGQAEKGLACIAFRSLKPIRRRLNNSLDKNCPIGRLIITFGVSTHNAVFHKEITFEVISVFPDFYGS